MKTALIALAIVAGLLVAPVGLRVVAQNVSSETVSHVVQGEAPPKGADTLEESPEIKLRSVKKVITLEDRNQIVLRGPVTGSSVAKAIKELQAASRRVSKDTPLYLVLDTPGGDINAGTDLIDFAKALPQKVHTVTLFAASMGFQIAQNLDTRYIITNGQLMSHRAKVSGVGGQIKGEFETRYRMLRRTVDALDFIAAKRMGTDVKTYEKMVFNEYWVYGFDAVAEKAADEEVLVRCGESLSGSDTVSFETVFGVVDVTFSKCPLIKEPEGVALHRIAEKDRDEAMKVIKMALLDKAKFVDTYITTARFSEIFR